MAHSIGNLALDERRGDAREEVFYRTRARLASAASVPLQIVNVSSSGFMARSDADLKPGDRLTLKLPVAGEVAAEIRWALGGRVGCQLDRPIAMVPYLDMLGHLVRESR